MDLDPDFLRHALIAYLLLVGSVVIHEWAHAFAAHLLGDDTPRADGRLTLDPRAHFDLYGTCLVPIVCILFLRTGIVTYGWGRPIFTNPNNFRHRVRDDVLVSLAGPFANLALALAATLLGCLIVPAVPRLRELVESLVVMNVGLAVLNLLPFPAFDGGNIVRRLANISDETYALMARWSWVVLLALTQFALWKVFLGSLVLVVLQPYLVLADAIRPGAQIFGP